MKRNNGQKRLKNREGMVLVVALMIMAVMSIIGTVAMTTSRTDLRMSYNTRVSKTAFYGADGGIDILPKVVRETYDTGYTPYFDGFYVDYELIDEVMKFSDESAADDSFFNDPPDPDVTGELGENDNMADIDRDKEILTPGSGAEFGSGNEGVGVGQGGGGVSIYFKMASLAETGGENKAQSHVDAYYRYVVGLGGGK